jgi:hypothetical protein
MRRLIVLAATVLWAATPAAAAQETTVQVTLDQTRITTTLGRVHSVESQITNRTQTPTGTLIAHLNVASLDGSYVDLEDWSADVTKAISLDPGESTAISWDFQTVNGGSFNVYVVVLPEAGSLAASPVVRVDVAEQRTLNAGGALPVAVAVPILLGIAAGAIRYRVRRRTQ